MSELVEIARSAALAGGTLVRQRAHAVGDVRSKSRAIDLVTEVDIASGVAVARTILASDPSAHLIVEEPEVHEVLGIEPGAVDDRSVWVVDPLDGTTSFVHGYPCYSVAVAHLSFGQVDAGAVYNAATGELFWAARGHGAFRDGEPLSCSETRSITEALLVTGFPYDRTDPLDRQLAVLAAFLRAPVHGIRRDGSAAVDCCHVASGRADGFWEYGLKVWDMAAGALICQEAGAVVTDIAGDPWTVESEDICAAGPTLHARMLALIHSVAG